VPSSRITDKNRRIGTALKAARQRAGLSRFAVASRIGTLETTYGQWEQGSASLKPAYIPRIADALGLSSEDLAAELADAAPDGPTAADLLGPPPNDHDALIAVLAARRESKSVSVLASELLWLRRARRLSQTELDRWAGVRSGTAKAIESWRLLRPTPETLRRFAVVLVGGIEDAATAPDDVVRVVLDHLMAARELSAEVASWNAPPAPPD
jgi:transcriptional regulator with XRE-family HTH domain